MSRHFHDSPHYVGTKDDGDASWQRKSCVEFQAVGSRPPIGGLSRATSLSSKFQDTYTPLPEPGRSYLGTSNQKIQRQSSLPRKRPSQPQVMSMMEPGQSYAKPPARSISADRSAAYSSAPGASQRSRGNNPSTVQRIDYDQEAMAYSNHNQGLQQKGTVISNQSDVMQVQPKSQLNIQSLQYSPGQQLSGQGNVGTGGYNASVNSMGSDGNPPSYENRAQGMAESKMRPRDESQYYRPNDYQGSPSTPNQQRTIHKLNQEPQKPPTQPRTRHRQSPSQCQQPPNQYQQPQNEYQQPPNEYQQPANQYQQPANQYQQTPNQYQQPSNLYQQPANQYQQSTNQYQQSPSQSQQPPNQYQQPPNQYQQHQGQYRQSPSQSQGQYRQSPSQSQGQYQQSPSQSQGQYRQSPSQSQPQSQYQQQPQSQYQQPQGQYQQPQGQYQQPQGQYQQPQGQQKQESSAPAEGFSAPWRKGRGVQSPVAAFTNVPPSHATARPPAVMGDSSAPVLFSETAPKVEAPALVGRQNSAAVAPFSPSGAVGGVQAPRRDEQDYNVIVGATPPQNPGQSYARIDAGLVAAAEELAAVELQDKLSPLQRLKHDYLFHVLYDHTNDKTVSRADFLELHARVKQLRGWTDTHPDSRRAANNIAHAWSCLLRGNKKYRQKASQMHIRQVEWRRYWGDFVEAARHAGGWPARSLDASIDYSWQHSYMNFMYQLMDTNGDGAIDLEEYTRCFASFGIPEQICRMAWEKFAKDKQGQPLPQIDLARFEELWFQYLTSDDLHGDPGNFLMGKLDF